MRVFVLCTGRCGSTTTAKACGHIANYSAGHETRAKMIGPERLEYRDDHIEVDNRLSWFLGGLQLRYGDAPLYVHLQRSRDEVIASFVSRFDRGIIDAFNGGVVSGRKRNVEAASDVCAHYVDTVNANIEAFLAGKPHTMSVWLEDAPGWFPELWDRIGATGDLDLAMSEFAVRHNATADLGHDLRPNDARSAVDPVPGTS